MDRRGFCFGATIALTAFACSSGPAAPGDSANLSGASVTTPLAQKTTPLTGLNVTGAERAGSPPLPEDGAPEHSASCETFGSASGHLSALLGQNLVARRGAKFNLGDTCSLFGDGVRVRFVTLVSAVSDASAQLKCHGLAGAGAEFVPGVGSMSWESAEGVFTAQGGQCVWTQVYTKGLVDLVASRTVALDAARRYAVQAMALSGQ